MSNRTTRPIPAPTESDAKRFWSKVKKTSSCWVWTSTFSNGYGVFGMSRSTARSYMAHRVAYEWLREPIPAGMVLDHICRNTGCVNPDHLDIVTDGENAMRGLSPWARKARQTHCLRGHEFTSENTYVRKNGTRWCLECARIRERGYDAKKREAK